jgi:hypothetical protein
LDEKIGRYNKIECTLKQWFMKQVVKVMGALVVVLSLALYIAVLTVRSYSGDSDGLCDLFGRPVSPLVFLFFEIRSLNSPGFGWMLLDFALLVFGLYWGIRWMLSGED